MTTIQYVLATGLSLVVFVGLANFVVDLYARGVARSAVDEAARAGAPVDSSTADCEQRAHGMVTDLLGGAMGRGVRITCQEHAGTVSAHATVHLAGWLPGVVPDWTFTLDGSALKEQYP
ncbi:MAG: hypothetical protein ACHQ52_14330 [Candidatus Eisenbacteria bacterium]